jgi:hypothetical protein
MGQCIKARSMVMVRKYFLTEIHMKENIKMVDSTAKALTRGKTNLSM